MPQPRLPVPRSKIDQTICDIRAYYKHGCSSLRQVPYRNTPGAIARQSKQLQWNETKLRKARQFADPETGYTPELVDELCRLLRAHRPVFGTAHVGMLVTVSWADGRDELQK